MVGFRPFITCVLGHLLLNGRNTRSIPGLGQGTRVPASVLPRLYGWDLLFWLRLDRRATFNLELTPDPSSAQTVSPRGHQTETKSFTPTRHCLTIHLHEKKTPQASLSYTCRTLCADIYKQSSDSRKDGANAPNGGLIYATC